MECHETAGGQLLMPEIVMYTTRWCPFCTGAKTLLNNKGVQFSEIPVDGDPALRATMAERAGATSVPQIWIGDAHIGGCDELFSLEQQGRLDSMLSGQR
jgi:glutaredoxin 3